MQQCAYREHHYASSPPVSLVRDSEAGIPLRQLLPVAFVGRSQGQTWLGGQRRAPGCLKRRVPRSGLACVSKCLRAGPVYQKPDSQERVRELLCTDIRGRSIQNAGGITEAKRMPEKTASVFFCSRVRKRGSTTTLLSTSTT